MQGLKIVAMGSALPRRVITNEEMSQMVETDDEWIRSRTGIGQRHRCEEETCRSLAIEAAKRAFDEAGVAPEDIGFVIVATTTSDTIFPSTACMVQQALGLSTEVMSFDLSAACSGFLYGMTLCHRLLLGSKKPYALLIGSEQLSRIVDYTDRSTCVLFGDGAAAAVLGLQEGDFYARAWSDGNGDVLRCNGIGIEGQYLTMAGKDVFRFAVRVIPEGIEAVLGDAGLTMDDVDLVVCHQANARIIDHVRRKYPGHEDKFFINIERYANTSAASIPLALDELRKTEKWKPGARVLCVGFGAGFTWSSVLFEV